ncbi:WG repeat-containing protein [Corallibacter vietnamensis]
MRYYVMISFLMFFSFAFSQKDSEYDHYYDLNEAPDQIENLHISGTIQDISKINFKQYKNLKRLKLSLEFFDEDTHNANLNNLCGLQLEAISYSSVFYNHVPENIASFFPKCTKKIKADTLELEYRGKYGYIPKQLFNVNTINSLELKLYQNLLKSDYEFFRNLINLKKLKLTNQESFSYSVNAKLFNGFRSLQVLKIHNSIINKASLKRISKLKTIKYLELLDSDFNNQYLNLSKLKNLESLSLESGLSKEKGMQFINTLNGDNKLKHLSITDCEGFVQDIEKVDFSKLSKLETLKIYAPIDKFPEQVKFLKNLSTLHLQISSWNTSNIIPESTYAYLQGLQTCSINTDDENYNRIMGLKADTIVIDNTNGDGVFLARNTASKKWGMFQDLGDGTFKELIPYNYDKIDFFGWNADYTKVYKNNKVGVYLSTWSYFEAAKETIPCIYDDLRKVNVDNKNYLAAKKNNKWGLIDWKTGEKVSQIDYDSLIELPKVAQKN